MVSNCMTDLIHEIFQIFKAFIRDNEMEKMMIKQVKMALKLACGKNLSLGISRR